VGAPVGSPAGPPELAYDGTDGGRGIRLRQEFCSKRMTRCAAANFAVDGLRPQQEVLRDYQSMAEPADRGRAPLRLPRWHRDEAHMARGGILAGPVSPARQRMPIRRLGSGRRIHDGKQCHDEVYTDATAARHVSNVVGLRASRLRARVVDIFNGSEVPGHLACLQGIRLDQACVRGARFLRTLMLAVMGKSQIARTMGDKQILGIDTDRRWSSI